MSKSLRLLVVEDSEDDCLLLLDQLARSDYKVEHKRIETADAMRQALLTERWDVVCSDYSLPTFSGTEALGILLDSGQDIPFILLSGTITEEMAVDALKAGAHDFLLKGRLARLVPAIERELREAEIRRQRRKAEEARRESDERFRTLVESMDEMVYTLDLQGRYDGVFGSWVARWGMKPEHFLGKTVEQIVGEVAATPHRLAQEAALRDGRAIYEWSTPGPDGSIRHFQTSLASRRNVVGEVVGLVGVGREITEQKRTQAQLVLSDRMASVGMLAAGVAHEINNPLASAVGNLELALQRVCEPGNPEDAASALLAEELSDARDALERIRHIVRDLKLFSRAADERLEPVAIERVLESTLRMARNEIRHRARVVKDYRPVPPVHGNESRLGQVFLNLIINAAQAIGEGHAEANEVRIRTLEMPDGRVAVEVEDTGTGMSPEVQAALFSPFFTTKPVGVGTGLGLSICHRIITAMGGEIQVQSQPGQGSTFRVLLPPAPSGATTKVTVLESPPTPKRKGRVLVVDDEPMVSRVIARVLEGSNDVVLAGSASKALECISENPAFDVILCDLMMPEMTGMDLHAVVRERYPDLVQRMVFLTGGAFTPRARAFLDGIENPSIEKPFNGRELRAVVNRYIT